MRLLSTLLLLNSVLFSLQIASAQPDLVLTSYTSVPNPVDITGSGDGSGRLFIVDKSGKIRIFDQNTNTLLSGNYLDISTKVLNNGERGLLGLAFHPNYASNGYFYVNYINTSGNTRISRFRAAPASSNTVDPSTELNLLAITQPYSNHNGGDLNFGPDGYLYIGMGDGGSADDPENRAQNPQELLGKMLRIDVDNTSSGNNYAIPATNPYVGVQSPIDYKDEIWAMGMRNPWRFSFDRSTGDLWIADVGQGAWEELDFQPVGSSGGANYGWRCYEGTHPNITSGCQPASSYASPIFEYSHNNATGGYSVTGGFVYRGTQVPSLQGWYIMADYVSDNFWLVKSNGSGWTVDLQTDVPVVDIVTFGEDDDGEVYASSLGGSIYKVSATPLPVTLLDFTGALRDGRVELKWSTSSEHQAAFFQVERKMQNGDFESIGTVQAAGESAVRQQYFFEDLFAGPGENMYRLKMVDLDNTFEYSPAVAVVVKNASTWQLSPNPATGQVSLSINSGPEIPNLLFRIFNALGQPVLIQDESAPAFPFTKEINLSNLPGGIYFCRLDAGGETTFKRLVLR